MSWCQLLTAAASFFLGIILGLWGMPAIVALFAGVIGVIFWILSVFGNFENTTVLATAGLCVILLSLGLFRASLDVGNTNETALDEWRGQDVNFEAVVSSRPEQTPYGQSFIVEVQRVSGEILQANTKAVVYAGAFPEVSVNDRLEISGEITAPEAFEGDNGRLFDYPNFLAKDEVFYTVFRPEFSVTGKAKTIRMAAILSETRRDFLSTIQELIPDPEAALAGGVLLGAEDALGDDLEEQFQDTGLIHIVVLSGFNVTIVAAIIGFLLFSLGLSRRNAALAAGVGIMLFALLVGLTATVLRASIMALFALVGQVAGRRYVAARGLVIAAVVMVAINPHILLYDPSFQLSAVATAGLIGFGDYIGQRLTLLPQTLGIREAATATISAQIAVLPLILYYMGTLSVVSLPANLLVLPVVPALMGATALVILFSFIAPVAQIFATLASLIGSYIIAVVQFLADLPFSVFTIAAFPLWVSALLYALMIWWVMQTTETSG